MGKFQDAIAEFQRGLQLGENPMFRAAFAHTYARSGKRVEAQRELGKLLEASKPSFVSPYFIATVYAGLDDKTKVFQWLEAAYRDRADWITCLKVDPEFDPIRSDPWFADIVRRIGLPP